MKIEITLQVEKERFVIKEIKPVSPKNMLLINLKDAEGENEGRFNHKLIQK